MTERIKRKRCSKPPQTSPQELLAGLLQEIVTANQEERKVWGVGEFLHSLDQKISEHAPYIPKVQQIIIIFYIEMEKQVLFRFTHIVDHC